MIPDPLPARPALPLTLDATDTGSLRVLDAAGLPVYYGPDVEELLPRVLDLTTPHEPPARHRGRHRA